MTASSRVALTLILASVHLLAQSQPPPQMRLTLTPAKATYDLAEPINVKVEFTNLTSETLCFPPPAQDCSVPTSGWVVVTGEHIHSNADENDWFICHVDAGGKYGNELDDAVRKEWVKLPPNTTYTAKQAKLKLNKAGDWKLVATYHPPTSDFGTGYQKMLQTAAKKSGCILPTSQSIAVPATIEVVSTNK